MKLQELHITPLTQRTHTGNAGDTETARTTRAAGIKPTETKNGIETERKMENKYYDPSLVWSLAISGIQPTGKTIIKIFLADGTTRSHFILRSSRIYWKQNPAQLYVVKCANNTLEENKKNLGEVVAENWHTPGDAVLLGRTYKGFIDYITTRNPF